MISGIDVSHWNTPDWAALWQQNFKFAWIKATEGTAWQDSAYWTHKDAAEAAGFKTGPYHYFRAAFDGRAQAQNLATIAGLDFFLPPAVDVERTGNTGTGQVLFQARLRACLLEVEALMGVRPIVYTSKSMWEELVGSGVTWAREYDLWVAHYSTAATAPILPSGWTEWKVWQHTSTPLDTNRMKDDYWAKLNEVSSDEVVLRLKRETFEELKRAVNEI